MASPFYDYKRWGALAESIGTTAAQLPAVPDQTKYLRLKASADNSGIIYIGPTVDVTVADGYPLAPGEETDLFAGNADMVFAVSDSGTNVLHVLWQG